MPHSRYCRSEYNHNFFLQYKKMDVKICKYFLNIRDGIRIYGS